MHPQLSPGRLRMRLDYPQPESLWIDQYPILIIEHADPVIEVTGQWLELVTDPAHPLTEFDGELLTLRGHNHSVIYRVLPQMGRYFERGLYLLVWPD